jgi:hypothetical protein
MSKIISCLIEIFLIIILIFKSSYLFILHIFTIIAYIFQYSGLNVYLHNYYLVPHAALTFGRFAEAFPLAVTGFTFASLNIIQKLKKNRAKALLYNFIIIIMISTFRIFHKIKNFKYGGIRLNIAASCLFIIFSLLPLEKIQKKYIIYIINKITRYTGGIYYMHYIIT